MAFFCADVPLRNYSLPTPIINRFPPLDAYWLE